MLILNEDGEVDYIQVHDEADESIYWLDLLYETDYLSDSEHKKHFDQAKEIVRMITSSIITSKKKLK